MLKKILFFASFILLCLAFCGSFFASDSGTSYEFQPGKILIDYKKPMNSVVFSPDGKLIASGSVDGSIKLWEAGSGRSIKSLIKHPSAVLCVSFKPGDNILAVGSESGAISLWDVNYKERIKTLKGHEGKVLSIRFSQDGKIMASGSADKAIQLWDMESGKEIKTLKGHTGDVNSLSFINNKSLASGSTDGSIKIWDISSGKNTLTLKEDTGSVNSVCFSPDGNLLASGSGNGTIRIWKIAENAEPLTFKSDSIGIDDCLSFSPDGRLLASGSAKSTITVWEANSGNVINEIKAHNTAVNSVVFSPDGKTLASAGEDGTVKLWKIRVIETLKIALDARYEGWQRGILKLNASVIGASDLVKFQYSLDGSTWKDIAELKELYSVEWDTRSSLPGVNMNVQIRATAERSTGATAMDMSPTSFSLDNEQPATTHDYDGLWHRSDFSINLFASDGDGSGLLITGYMLNNGAEKNIRRDGQPKITEEGINILEYWSVDKLGNVEMHKNLPEVKLDKTAPVFVDWSKKADSPAAGALRVSVKIIDKGGSGLEGKIPQFDYHIGQDTAYSGYKIMSVEGSDFYYDIPEPADGWDKYKGKPVYYKAKCEDMAGNVGESVEQQELIGIAKVPPTVKLTNVLRSWEKGLLVIKADASDTDGTITNVKFEYSLDGAKWALVNTSSTPPYTAEWDTAKVVPELAKVVQIKITATDNDGLSAYYTSPVFGIDNQAPVTNHDYDGLWHKADFAVNLIAKDGDGSGISSTKYKINNGYERDVLNDRQPKIDEQGENTLEYWSIDSAGNEESHKALAGIKLDRMSPSFESWNVQREGNILRVEVKITDKDSGIEAAPQIDYHIGLESKYSGYKDMEKVDAAQWKYNIDISKETAGETLFCKVNAKDKAGNLGIKMWEHEITDGAVTSGVKVPSDELPLHGAASKSSDVKVETRQKSAVVWNSQTTDTVMAGSKADLKGYLTPQMDRPVSLNITLIAPDDTIYVSQTYTSSRGIFELSVPLTTEGEWRVIAKWDGDPQFEGATSETIKLNAISEESSTSINVKSSKFLRRSTIIMGVLILYILVIGVSR